VGRVNQNIRALVIHNLGAVSNDHVAKAEFSQKKKRKEKKRTFE
jgi:hypothetical protein